MIYYDTADQALNAAKKFLRGNTRPHALIGRNRKGFMIIDPRDKKSHYSKIFGKLYRKK
jgi:hypothetical protein